MEDKVIAINGRPEDIQTILNLLNHIEKLGKLGASRNLLVRVDGDGAGRMTFADLETLQRIPDYLEAGEYSKQDKMFNCSGVFDIG